MLFHADRNLKQNLFQMYKKDAEDHHNKKNEMKLRQMNEERMYMENMNKRQQQEEDRRKLEKYKRVTDTMNEYKDMISHKERFRGKKNEVNFNTYGVSMREANPENASPQNIQNAQNVQQNFNGLSYEFNSGNIEPGLERIQAHAQVEAQGISNLNHPPNENYSEFFNKNFGNNNSINNFDNSRLQKHEQQKSYKEFLDSQVSQRPHKKTQSNNESFLFSNYSNPYNNKNYEIGGSSLNHNPILNPTNNFSYNKYLMNNFHNPPNSSEIASPNNYQNNNQNFNSNLQGYRQQSNLPTYNPINNTLNYDNLNYNNPNNFNYANNVSNNPLSQTPSGGERLRMAANNILR